MTRPRTVLTVAGSDPSGGAGIQADLRTFAKTGVNGSAAITALTAQTRKSVNAVNLVSPEVVASQIDAAFSDSEIDAVKTGMLGNAAIVRATVEALHAPRRAKRRRRSGAGVVERHGVARRGWNSLLFAATCCRTRRSSRRIRTKPVSCSMLPPRRPSTACATPRDDSVSSGFGGPS